MIEFTDGKPFKPLSANPTKWSKGTGFYMIGTSFMKELITLQVSNLKLYGKRGTGTSIFL